MLILLPDGTLSAQHKRRSLAVIPTLLAVLLVVSGLIVTLSMIQIGI